MSSTVKVSYFVEGSAYKADLTMQTATGSSQLNDVRLPLTNKGDTPGLHFTMPQGSFVYLSAQNQGAGGDVTCRIEVDGETISTNLGSGGYAIATCNGSA